MVTMGNPSYSSILPEDEVSQGVASFYNEKKASYEHSSSFDSLQYIKINETTYKFLSPVTTWTVYDQNRWICQAANELRYIGISETSREDAFENFKFQIHIRFQQLYSMRPFEMTGDEYGEWICLANTIDLLHYKTTTPIKIREVGCISFGKLSYPYRIKWLTDENYIIDPLNVPAELMSCKPGRWIEAVVERDPVNYRVIKISSIRKIKFHIPSEATTKKYWNEMDRIKLNK